ncbi:MAG: PHP domain-containing protein [archaeon]
MLFDLHLHSRFSVDALTKPETIVKICKKQGIGFSLTDHNNMAAYTSSTPGLNIRKLAKKHKVLLIPGEEIKVVEGRRVKGEVIAYLLQEPIKPGTIEDILYQVSDQDALLSCPHPFDWPRKNYKPFKKNWKCFDAMETYNARAYYRGLNKHSQKFFVENAKDDLAALGVSDAHTPEEIGNGLTLIDAHDEESFRKQVKKRKTTVVIKRKATFWHHAQTQLARNWLIKDR